MRSRFSLFFAVALLCGTVGVAAGAEAPSSKSSGVSVDSIRVVAPGGVVRPGSPFVLVVEPSAVRIPKTVGWNGKAYPLIAAMDNGASLLLGVDLEEKGTSLPLTVLFDEGGLPLALEIVVAVSPRSFPTQKLSLPEKMASFDDETLVRIRREADELKDIFSRPPEPPRYRLPFVPPVAGFVSKNFGSRRIINGEPRAPHTGVDVTLPEGTPVVSVTDGVVVSSGEQFFGGQSVVVDHGGGLFSIYMHLSSRSVAVGDTVAQGQKIGTVGSTGRATGPHLHFSVRIVGSRVDPGELMRIVDDGRAVYNRGLQSPLSEMSR